MKKAENKLTIGFVLDTTLDVEDGVQQYILVLGDWLKKQGHEVHYIVGETKRKDIQNLHSLSKNIKVNFNGNKIVMPLPVSTKKIKNFLAKQYFDVLHVQVPYSPFYGAKIVKHAKKDTVVIGTFHILPFGMVAYVGTWLLGLALRNNLKRFNQQISVSTANQEFSAKTFKTKSIVLPNMVKMDEFKPPSDFVRKNKKIEILYLGRLTKRKGCTYLLKAVSRMVKTHPDVKFNLKIAGKGEQLVKLKKQSKILGIDEYIQFLGFVSNEEKVRLMRNADISVFPSYSGECFGIVLIEAISAKSGVVIGGQNFGYYTVLGEIPESLVDVKDSYIFSEKLYKFVGDEKFRKSINKKQQKIVLQYDYELVGKKVLDVYKNCIITKNKT